MNKDETYSILLVLCAKTQMQVMGGWALIIWSVKNRKTQTKICVYGWTMEVFCCLLLHIVGVVPEA